MPKRQSEMTFCRWAIGVYWDSASMPGSFRLLIERCDEEQVAKTPEEQTNVTREDGSAADETLLEPFDPPTLEQLDAEAEWIDMPVIDSLTKRRALEADEKPLVSVDEALRLRNTSPEANAKIVSALGQLASENGRDVDWDASISRALRQETAQHESDTGQLDLGI